MGRALTKAVAERLATSTSEDVRALVWTGLYLVTGLGIVAAAGVVLFTPILVTSILKVPEGLVEESTKAFWALGLSIPFVTGYIGIRGTLEAWHRFDLTNAVRIPLGSLTLLAPVGVLPFSRSLGVVVAAIALVRVLAFIAQLILAVRALPELMGSFRPRLIEAKPLLRFGSWMTVSNVLSPLMVVLDRFLIGALISLTAVAYYATPYEAVTKLLVLPAALVGVLFPTFSAITSDTQRAGLRLYNASIKALTITLFPLCLLVVILAREILGLWLGPDFASRSSLVLQLLTVGVFINGLAAVPFALIQGTGRPDITARVHLVELPVYLAALWLLLHEWGITGAAIAWTSRTAIDAVVLFVIVRRSYKTQDASPDRFIGLLVAALLTTLAIPASFSWLLRSLLAVVALAVFFRYAITSVLADNERMIVAGWIKCLRRVESR